MKNVWHDHHDSDEPPAKPWLCQPATMPEVDEYLTLFIKRRLAWSKYARAMSDLLDAHNPTHDMRNTATTAYLEYDKLNDQIKELVEKRRKPSDQ